MNDGIKYGTIFAFVSIKSHSNVFSVFNCVSFHLIKIQARMFNLNVNVALFLRELRHKKYQHTHTHIIFLMIERIPSNGISTTPVKMCNNDAHPNIITAVLIIFRVYLSSLRVIFAIEFGIKVLIAPDARPIFMA